MARAGRTFVAFSAAIALVAAACGTQVSSRQATVEAREDARRAGLAGRAATGSALAGNVGDEANGGAGAIDTGLPSASGAASGSGVGARGAASSGGAAGAVRAPAPAGGNGGATDIGVFPSEVRWGWVGTLTGPVPGLFRGALIGTQAFAAYQNSQGGLFGRRIRVLAADDALDSGKNRGGHLQLKDKVFAFVGSFSVTDDGGATVLGECKCPDIGGALSRARVNLPIQYDPQPQPDGWRAGFFNWVKANYPPDVYQHVAFFVSAIQSAREIAANERAVMESLGFKVVYTREVQANETQYGSDIVQMQRTGAQMLIWQGDVGNMGRMAKSIHEQGYKLALANWGGAIYDDNAFTIAGGDPAGKEALEGTLFDNLYGMFRGEDAQRIPEIALFLQWMRRIDPNQSLDLFAWYGWLSARLTVEAMQKMGPLATRPKLLSELSKMGTWDANGAIAPINVGKRRPADCFMVTRIHDGKYVRHFPVDRNYACEFGGYVYR